MAIHGELQSVVSEPVASEWLSASKHPDVAAYFRRRGVSIGLLEARTRELIEISELVVPTGEPPPCRDEKDRKYLHCAVTATADYLVTTDLDLLVIETIGATRIVRPGQLWAILSADA